MDNGDVIPKRPKAQDLPLENRPKVGRRDVLKAVAATLAARALTEGGKSFFHQKSEPQPIAETADISLLKKIMTTEPFAPRLSLEKEYVQIATTLPQIDRGFWALSDI